MRGALAARSLRTRVAQRREASNIADGVIRLGCRLRPFSLRLASKSPAADGNYQARWLLACASGAAGAVGLTLGTKTVFAEEFKPHQEVYAWGRAEAMPGGAARDVLRPVRLTWFEENPAGWANIAFGPNFGLALDRRGRIFIWGEGEDCAFVGPVEVDVQGDAAKQLFVDAQCASEKIFTLTKRGQAYIFDTPLEALRERSKVDPKSRSPLVLIGRKVPGLPAPSAAGRVFGGDGVKQMSIGLEHACFVSNKGDLYCVGGSSWGQCGVEPPRQKGPMGALEERVRIELMSPVRVEMPETAGPLESVAVGGRHTIAMNKEGRTFAFGDDRRIQLGLGDTRSTGTDDRHSMGVLNRENLGGVKPKAEIKRHANYKYYDPHMQATPLETIVPKAYNRPPYPRASKVACGEDFTIALHRDSPDWYEEEQETNLLFCCGENGYGQCGRNLHQQQHPWLSARLPKRARTIAFACGQAHSLALLSNGDVYGWGFNQQGQVGNGSRANVGAPTRVRLDNVETTPAACAVAAALPVSRREGMKIESVACGFRNSAIIVHVSSPAPTCTPVSAPTAVPT